VGIDFKVWRKKNQSHAENGARKMGRSKWKCPGVSLKGKTQMTQNLIIRLLGTTANTRGKRDGLQRHGIGLLYTEKMERKCGLREKKGGLARGGDALRSIFGKEFRLN